MRLLFERTVAFVMKGCINMKKKADISVIIMVLAVVAVVVLGAVAITPTIKTGIDQRKAEKLMAKVQDGTATVEDMANLSGYKADEFLAQYGLTTDDVGAKANASELAEKMTLENYCKYLGLTYTDEDLETFKLTSENAKDISADTKDVTLKNEFAQYLSAKVQAEQETLEGESETTEGVDTEENNDEQTADAE